jgi:hypothetical protein
MAEAELRDPQGELYPLACLILSKSEWSCIANLRGAAEGEVYVIHSRVTDEFGNLSEWSDWLEVVVDRQAPTVSLDTDSQTALNSIFTGREVILSGVVTDNHSADSVEVCKGPLRGWMDNVLYLPLALGQSVNHGSPQELKGQEYCERVSLLPGAGAIGSWIYSLTGPPGVDSAAQELRLYGLDAAGNRTAEPVRYTIHIDTVSPSVITTTFVTSFSLAAYQAAPFPILTGNAQDGSGNVKLTFYLTLPDASHQTEFWSGIGAWDYQPLLEQVGQYTLIIEATDRAGNTSYKVSKFEVQP